MLHFPDLICLGSAFAAYTKLLAFFFTPSSPDAPALFPCFWHMPPNLPHTMNCTPSHTTPYHTKPHHYTTLPFFLKGVSGYCLLRLLIALGMGSGNHGSFGRSLAYRGMRRLRRMGRNGKIPLAFNSFSLLFFVPLVCAWLAWLGLAACVLN